MSLSRFMLAQSARWLLSAVICLASLAACAVDGAWMSNSVPAVTEEPSLREEPWPTSTTPAPAPSPPAPVAISLTVRTGAKAPGGVVVTEILSMRAGPGYRYRKVGELLKGAEFDIMARWCAYNRDEDWYLIGIHGDEQRWIPGGRQYVSTWLADNLVCLVPPPTPTATPVDPHFQADRTVITPGECAQLTWQAEQVQAIYLDGDPVPWHDMRRVCPAQTWTYVLTVIERDGRRNDYSLTIEVKGPTQPTAEPVMSESTTPTPIQTATPTLAFPQVITDSDRLLEFQLAIGRYRLAEKAALRFPDSDAVEQLRDFASGEALETALEQVKQLRKQGLVAELSVPQMDVRIAILQDERTAGVLVQERRRLKRYRLTSDGSVPVDEQVFDGTMVYGLSYTDSQWKVARIRQTNSPEQ